MCAAYALGCVCRLAAGDTLLKRNGYQLKITFHSINLCQDHSEICYVRSVTKFSEKSLISPIQTAAASLRNMWKLTKCFSWA